VLNTRNYCEINCSVFTSVRHYTACGLQLLKDRRVQARIVAKCWKRSQEARFVTSLLYYFFPIRGGNACCYCFPQMLRFTEARENLGKELGLQSKQERTHELWHKQSCGWQKNGKTESIFRCRLRP